MNQHIDFEEFKPATAPQTKALRLGGYNCSLCIRSRGAVSLSQAASELLGVKDGDRVTFLRDRKYPSDWYVAKSDDGYRLKLDGRRCLTFFSEPLAVAVIRSVVPDTSNVACVTFTVAHAETGCALNTKTPRITNKKPR